MKIRILAVAAISVLAFGGLGFTVASANAAASGQCSGQV